MGIWLKLGCGIDEFIRAFEAEHGEITEAEPEIKSVAKGGQGLQAVPGLRRTR